MKSRLPLILLGIVIFSTALLTLLAARSLQRDEIMAQRRSDELAGKAARTAAALVQGRLLAELDQVRNAMADAASGGGDLLRVRTMATRMEQSRPLVRRIYLFMNPWGFVWPSDPTDDAEEIQLRQALLETLRNLAASSASPSDPLGFTLGGKAYLFGAAEGKKVLYVGYEVAPAHFVELLTASLREAEGGGVVLGAEGEGIHVPAGHGPDTGRVVVEDSLGQQRVMDGAPADADSLPRAVQALPPPMAHVRILAYSTNLDEVRRTVAVRHQLYRWGLVMLALGIIGGVGLLVSAARAEIRQARSGSEVALGVSHDLRTPIASMKILAESMLLGHVPDPARQQEFLRTIVEECERLSQLTERVLFLFRFGQDAVEYLLRPSDLGRCVRGAVGAFEARYAAGGIASGASALPEIQLQVEAPVPCVRLDETAFGQVMLNLLDNAAKYGKKNLPTGGAVLNIDITVRRQELRRRWGWPRRSWVSVTVRDHGGGIARQYQRRIFHRFYRVPETRDVNLSGVGLGLSVCKHVMEGHGGWIEVRSAPGEGSAFTLYLPVDLPMVFPGAAPEDAAAT